MSRQAFYNQWYKTRRPQWDNGQAPSQLLDFLNQHPPGNALDLGCGTGTHVITLAKSGWQATGVDFAAEAIKMARQKARENQVDVKFRTGDITRVRFPANSFILILDWGCFQGLAHRRDVYAKRISQWLAPGGHFLLYSLKHQVDIPGFGITDEDLQLFSDLNLVKREDGFNQGPVTRASVWLQFVKPPVPV